MKLEVKDGCFSYDDHRVLNKVCMNVEDNDVYAVLGRNGAGKTTLLRCIMGMLRWESGAAYLDGEDISRIPYKQLWRSVAYVPQAKRGSDSTVRDMVVLGRSAHIGLFDKPGKEDYAIADEILQRLYISHLAYKPCSKLSGGELQLVLIGRALASEPKLLVMDEPESNLDYHNQLHVLSLVASISKTTACILNTHYPEHALRYANKALLLHQDGSSISGSVGQIVTEANLKRAFGIDVHIGSQHISGQDYKYIIPLHSEQEA